MCVTPVAWDSKRFCAVTYDTGDIIILIVCIYMPCDDWRPDGNVIEYIDILNEISTLSNGVKSDLYALEGILILTLVDLHIKLILLTVL